MESNLNTSYPDEESMFLEDGIEAAHTDDMVIMEDEGRFEVQQERDGNLQLSDKNGVFGVIPPSEQVPVPDDISEESFEEEPKKERKKVCFAVGLCYACLLIALAIGLITYTATRDGGSRSTTSASAVSGGNVSAEDGNGDRGIPIDDPITAAITSFPTAAPSALIRGTVTPSPTPAEQVVVVDTSSPTPNPSTPSPPTPSPSAMIVPATPSPTEGCKVSAITMTDECLVSPATVAVDFSYCDPLDDDWIGVYAVPASPDVILIGDEYVAWVWTCGENRSGCVKQAIPASIVDINLPEDIPSGTYQAFLMRNNDLGDAPFDIIADGPTFEVTDGACN